MIHDEVSVLRIRVRSAVVRIGDSLGFPGDVSYPPVRLQAAGEHILSYEAVRVLGVREEIGNLFRSHRVPRSRWMRLQQGWIRENLMEHKWANEVMTRVGCVDVCDHCAAMRVRPKNDTTQYIGKEAKMSPAVPSCKQGDEKSQATASR